MSAIELADAAFGAHPGRWPLPAASTAAQCWLRAVAAGGQGRYAAARAALDDLARHRPPSRWASLALSTRASFLRQLGWHHRAAGLDGRALALAGADAEAAVDALAGLAADALGVGRLAASATLLDRARAVHRGADEPPPRLAIRLAWVGAELAMAGGDGTSAREHAVRAVELAVAAGPALSRHRVKSAVVLAAAQCCAGDPDAARATAETALANTLDTGLVPLSWAVCCLLGDLGGTRHTPAEVDGIREASAAFVARHGGTWSGR